MLERNYVIFTAVDKGITQDEIELYKIAFSSAAMALGNYGVGNEEAAGRGKLRESLNYELFCKLLNHTDDFGELLVNRFEKTGFNLLDRNFIAIFEIKFDDSCKTLNKNERNNNDVKKKLNNIFRKNLKDRSSLLVPKDNEWVLLIGFSEDECAKDVLYKKAFQEIFDHLIVEINNMNLNTSLSAGVSSSTKNIAGIKKAYMEAGIAKEIGKRVRSGENIFFYEDLGIYKFLSIPDKDEILKDKRIRSIYEYDKKNNASLIDTLDAFMDTNGRIKDTAKKIFTHPNTVKYRLNKIKELAGEEILKNDNKRLYYHIMVKALKLILKKA
jgi:purine catabolism regulator